jgi:Phycobilisome protein
MLARIPLRYTSAYPTAAEREEIEGYLATVKARRAAHAEVRRVVQGVAEDVVDRMKQVYPQFARHRSAGFDKGKRDILLLTNMAANAMFLGDHDTLDDMFTHWYRTMIKGVHLPPQFMKDTFRFWLLSLEANLSAEAYSLLRPHAEHLADTLADVPVPARDEVGERRAVAAR